MKTQFSPHMLSRVALALVAFGLGAQAQAQISSINSAVVTPRFFNDMTSATGTYINNYPTAITLGESGAWRATSGGLDRDLWQFSNNNGSSAYTFGANDHFTATITLNVSGTTAVDNEAGFIIPNANSTFGGGDLQFLADPNSGFLGMFGGTGFWNSGLTYTAGSTVTLGMTYFFDAAKSQNAFQFWVNNGSGNIFSPVQDWSGSLAGDTVGGYYQIGNSGSAPGSSGQAVFGNLSIAPVPEPSVLALLALGFLPLLRHRRVA
ncbi:MAG TPA: hypothetical protein VG146_11420 [Verrucomicrobiae bacterium]|nr:hypothetical protein [Verrucomicrobiae bacterium]